MILLPLSSVPESATLQSAFYTLNVCFCESNTGLSQSNSISLGEDCAFHHGNRKVKHLKAVNLLTIKHAKVLISAYNCTKPLKID